MGLEVPEKRGRWGTCVDRAETACVNHSARGVASFRRQWLPEPNGSANSGRESKMTFRTPRGPCSISQNVEFGTEQDAIANSVGGRSHPGTSCSCSMVNRERRGCADLGSRVGAATAQPTPFAQILESGPFGSRRARPSLWTTRASYFRIRVAAWARVCGRDREPEEKVRRVTTADEGSTPLRPP